MNNKPLHKELSTVLQSTRLNSESTSKRKCNIEWIRNLDRATLEYNTREKLLLVHLTLALEQIYIQYPGKESRLATGKPWDFRPKIYRNDAKEPERDISFAQIWDILFNNCEELIKNNRSDLIAVIATIFYRLAFMSDHQLVHGKDERATHTVSFGSDNNIVNKVDPGLISLHGLYKYSLPNEVVTYVSKSVPDWGGLSFEAFLFLNDLLAWNEDCKYFYRNMELHNGRWISKTGRVNTVLSHISFLGLVVRQIKLSEVLQRFARGRGVCPASNDEAVKICDGYLS